MRCNYTLGVVIECAAILLITLISSTSAVNLDSPRNNLRLAALLSLKVGGVQRVQILFGGDILQDSLDPQKVTCLCRILWEEIITPEGDVEFQPPQDWVPCKEFEFQRDILVRLRNFTNTHSFTLEIKEEEYFVQDVGKRVAVSPVWRLDLAPHMSPFEWPEYFEDAYQLNTKNLPPWTLVSEQ